MGQVKDNIADGKPHQISPWAQYSDRKRKLPLHFNIHRVGPAPKDEWNNGKHSHQTNHIADLDCDEIEIERKLKIKKTEGDRNEQKNRKRKMSASNRTILIYFSRLAKTASNERIDYNFLHLLIRNGADVNISDRHGQCVIHEVARNWNIDVVRFLMSHGADINIADKYGRTPLHIASASSHADMVDFLLRNGANVSARTYGEKQTVVHYAAKYNAVASLKIFAEHRLDFNVRDYQGRTPLYLAARMGRVDSSRYLLDMGIAVGVYDDTGMSCIAFMIEKIPQVACEALNQFVQQNVGQRKDLFYLNYLDRNPITWAKGSELHCAGYELWQGNGYQEGELELKRRLACPITPLELAVRRGELKVLMHPAMQQLIQTKWQLFGRYGAVAAFMLHFIYVAVWTFLTFLLPMDGEFYSNGNIFWRLPLESFCVVITCYFIGNIIWKNKIVYNSNLKFRLWIRRQIYRDLKYCHPRWTEEEDFLGNELDALRSQSDIFFRIEYPWDLLEITTYFCVITVIITRIMSVFTHTDYIISIHIKTMVFTLIFLWLHFLKSCRPFPALGIFITLLVYALKETMKFAGMFFIFCIPYAIGFWVIFGNRIDSDDPDNEWNNFNDILYFTWQVTVKGSWNKEPIMLNDRILSQMLLGSFYAIISTLLLNMYIALLTETFIEVYNNAKAHALKEQASIIINIEKLLSQSIKEKVDDYIQDNCGPLEVDMEESDPFPSEEDLWFNVSRRINRRLEVFKTLVMEYITPSKKKETVLEQVINNYKKEKEEYILYEGVMARDKELFHLQQDLYELKCVAMKLFNPNFMLPKKPFHVPLPVLNIKEPNIPLLLEIKGIKVDGSNRLHLGQTISKEWTPQNVDIEGDPDVDQILALLDTKLVGLFDGEPVRMRGRVSSTRKVPLKGRPRSINDFRTENIHTRSRSVNDHRMKRKISCDSNHHRSHSYDGSDNNMKTYTDSLFRTIMNVKTARMRYKIEPNRENIQHILSMINEDESILRQEKENLR